MVCNSIKKSSFEEKNKSLNSIISQNAQLGNELYYIFSAQALSMANKKELINYERLAQEVPYKWCRDKVKEEWKRRFV